MPKTILIAGHGPGISDAVARKFGAAGFSVGLAARSGEKLKAAVTRLAASGVTAAAFPVDLGDPAAVKALVESVRSKLGPPTIIHWNAYDGSPVDLAAPTASVGVRRAFDVSVTGLVAAVGEALGDLKAAKNGAVLVTGGGLAQFDPKIDALAVQWGAMGLALGKASQHKLVGLLAERLRPEGIYVAEVMVLGIVKGTAFDASGQATLTADSIADKFWEMYSARSDTFAKIG